MCCTGHPVQAEALLSKNLRWEFGGGFYNKSGLNQFFIQTQHRLACRIFLRYPNLFRHTSDCFSIILN
jgi:hypothetical protein